MDESAPPSSACAAKRCIGSAGLVFATWKCVSQTKKNGTGKPKTPWCWKTALTKWCTYINIQYIYILFNLQIVFVCERCQLLSCGVVQNIGVYLRLGENIFLNLTDFPGWDNLTRIGCVKHQATYPCYKKPPVSPGPPRQVTQIFCSDGIWQNPLSAHTSIPVAMESSKEWCDSFIGLGL